MKITDSLRGAKNSSRVLTLAAAEARARNAEQEVTRLTEALQAAEGSVHAKVERELGPLRDTHDATLEELKKEHEEELGGMEENIKKLEKKVKKLTKQLAIANDNDSSSE